MCFSVYLFNQATYWIAPKGQCFGPRHRHAHVGDALPEAYNTMLCFLSFQTQMFFAGLNWLATEFRVKPLQLRLVSRLSENY